VLRQRRRTRVADRPRRGDNGDASAARSPPHPLRGIGCLNPDMRRAGRR